MPFSIVVLGSGVIGLSTANELLKRFGNSVNVVIFTAEKILNTTSVLSGAAWTPGFGIQPIDKVREWSHTSLYYFRELSKEHPTCGVRVRSGYQFGKDPKERITPPQEQVDYEYNKHCNMKLITPENDTDGMLKNTIYDHAYKYDAVGFDMVHLLKFLEKQFFKLGGQDIKLKKVNNVEKDIFQQYPNVDLVVNCTGMGSRELFNDIDMEPVRGQAILVQVPHHIGEDVQKKVSFYFDETELENLTYILPRNEGRYVLGGTFDKNITHTRVLSHVANSILDRCDKMVPSLKLHDAKIIEHWVGLRPFRKSGVRVGLDLSFSKPIIHNYGHGGSGVTVSYGTAVEVVQIAEGLIKSKTQKSKL
ncbi:D-aspartate oxidase [Acrasis kona]|uniref:D-aspartate oxidase n=1 Tax=Acrasis kona TaxID=1008807 RepID=A0AAW2YM08_9EUKA